MVLVSPPTSTVALVPWTSAAAVLSITELGAPVSSTHVFALFPLSETGTSTLPDCSRKLTPSGQAGGAAGGASVSTAGGAVPSEGEDGAGAGPSEVELHAATKTSENGTTA